MTELTMKLKMWWRVWSDLIQRLLALTGSVASLSGLLVAFLPSPTDLPWWAIALLLLAIFCLVVLVVLELLAARGRRVYARADTDGIRGYMHDWIKHGGRVAIWTRDMSWAHNPDTRGLLNEKAKQEELILCLPKPNELARELAAAGAEVCAYGTDLLESPASRFTISYFGRGGARVAVGRAEGDAHVIDEFDEGGHPAFYLAEDLVAFARAKEGKGRVE
jgi:hypothetical protein